MKQRPYVLLHALPAVSTASGPPSVASLSELEQHHNVSRIVAAIRAGQVIERADGHLELPEGISWPAADSNILFVRKYYAPLFESVLNRCRPCAPGQDMSDQRRIVTGQPGIGKSVWW